MPLEVQGCALPFWKPPINIFKELDCNCQGCCIAQNVCQAMLKNCIRVSRLIHRTVIKTYSEFRDVSSIWGHFGAIQGHQGQFQKAGVKVSSKWPYFCHLWFEANNESGNGQNGIIGQKYFENCENCQETALFSQNGPKRAKIGQFWPMLENGPLSFRDHTYLHLSESQGLY